MPTFAVNSIESIVAANVPGVDIQKFVGKGTYGRVWKGSLHGYEIAIKWTSQTDSGSNDASYHYWMTKLHRELEIQHKLVEHAAKFDEEAKQVLSRVSVKLITAYMLSLPHDHGNVTHVYQIVEYFYQNLESFCAKNRHRFNSMTVHFIMHEMVLGLYYLHGIEIIHRDLSLDNTLINWEQKRIVISDFGQARFTKEISSSIANELFHPSNGYNIFYNHKSDEYKYTPPAYVGKIHFRPPEGLCSFKNGHYDQSWDVWQLGVIFLTLMCQNEHPWVRQNDLNKIDGKSQSAAACERHMLRLIEEGFGYPSDEEIQHLLYYYPDSIKRTLQSPEGGQKMKVAHQERLTKFHEKVQIYEKDRRFSECRTKGASQNIDIHRYYYLMNLESRVTCSSMRSMTFLNLPVVSDALQEIVLSMLRYSPTRRPSIKEVMHSNFIQNAAKWRNLAPLHPQPVSPPMSPPDGQYNKAYSQENQLIPNDYSLRRIPSITPLESIPDMMEQCGEQETRKKFANWFAIKFNADHVLLVHKIYGPFTLERRVQVISVLRRLVDRGIEPKMSVQEERNVNGELARHGDGKLRVFCVDNDNNSGRYWSIIVQTLNNYMLIGIKNALLIFTVI